MNYTIIRQAFTASAAFRSATLSQRGIWITLIQYCAAQENGGKIANFTEWRPAQTSNTLSIDKRRITASSPLWHMEGPHLIVHGYPTDKQNILTAKRTTLTANRTKTTPAKKHTPPPPPTAPELQPMLPEEAKRQIAEIYADIKQQKYRRQQ